MSEKVLTIEETMSSSKMDNTEVFKVLYEGTVKLREKLTAAFPVQIEEGCKQFNSFKGIVPGVEGSVYTYTGKEIEHLIHSWLGNPGNGFINIHLNTWLGQDTKTPHLAIVFGTIPHLFFYFDYVPRSDMTVDLEYLDRYYTELNQTYLQFHEDKRFRPFVSRTPYMRQAISSSGICFQGDVTMENILHLQKVANEMADRWIEWVKNDPKVSESERPALKHRDEFVRRAVAVRDPANSYADKLLGQDLADRLIKQLWQTDESREKTQ